MDILSYNGGFTSKRGVSWNYHISPTYAWVEQWHGNIVRKTGGWKVGRDTYSRHITDECFDAIWARFEFKRDPDHEDQVIIPDRSHDVLVCQYVNDMFDWIVSISRMPEGKYRGVMTHNSDCLGIITFSDLRDVDVVLRQFSSAQ